jgi:dephospho-CoA kinase
VRIALVGKMGSGKSEAAKYLEVKYGFTPYAFADPIKAICRGLFPDICKKGKPRELYQKVGQFMREIDPLVWVKWTLRAIEGEQNNRILITDIRQENEYIALKEKGFVVIKIHADDDIRWRRCVERGDQFTEEDFNHETETAVDSIPFDYLVTNNTSLADMHGRLDEIMAKVGGLVGFDQNRQTSE